jgi:8-oxo-dGTP pyrophosphatase MutT (NUDIX family)
MTFNSDKKQVDRVGAVLLIRKDGAALMQHRDDKVGLRNSGKWVPPGGHAEDKEDMKTCAQREFLEETAYDCHGLQFLTEVDDYVEGWPPYSLSIFWAYYDEVQKVQCLEGQNLKFVSRGDAHLYDIPKNILNLWDMTLKIAND